MTKFISALFATALLLSLASTTQAAVCDPSTTSRANCINEECSTLGLTRMDKDQKNILACLYNDSGAKIWKSNSGSSAGTGCPAQTFYISMSNAVEKTVTANTAYTGKVYGMASEQESFVQIMNPYAAEDIYSHYAVIRCEKGSLSVVLPLQHNKF